MADRSGGSTNGHGALSQDLHTDRLKQEVQDLLMALAERAMGSLSDKVGGVTDRLSDIGPDGGPGLMTALTGGKSPVGALLGGGLSRAKEKVKETLTGGAGKGGGDKDKKIKVTNIVEQIDVGVPVSTAYDYWTQFEEFPAFMKKVESVEQESESELEWKAQVLWSHRKWQATILEQVPDEMIVWQSKAEKGHVDGAVTFHELSPSLTRILLVLQYHPQGFFEQTGNIWRAQGRRARLELKHFRRHVMTDAFLNPEEIEGWRGEIHEGEVVSTGEEEPEDEREEAEDEYDESEEEPEDEYGESEGEPEDEYEEEEEEPEDEYEEEEEEREPPDADEEAEDEDAHPDGSKGRKGKPAQSPRRRSRAASK
ncbi:SRPBCC family protein [Streptomyces sp. NPDC051776]|uniref:SRPBCC family protein n=1 Tax=Streptomyces sp. NPDC051776 TaxID=3155414 RepID=UPI0034123176